jgi:hypothetical protein
MMSAQIIRTEYGCNVVRFDDGCTIRTGQDGRRVVIDLLRDETPEFGPLDFWAHWTAHEARGEVETRCYGPSTYNHVDVLVCGI